MTHIALNIPRLLALNLLATVVACSSETSATEDAGSTSSGSTSTAPSTTAPGTTAPTSTGSTSSTPTDDTGQGSLPEAPNGFELDLAQVKQFEFRWEMAVGAEYYQLLESADGKAPFVQVGDDVIGLATSLTVPVYARVNARYMLRACNIIGCTESPALKVTGTLVEAVGYFKASNTGADDHFGWSVALSGDGRTLAVGAEQEGSNASGIDGNQADNSAGGAGAVYLYVRDGKDVWTQQAYVKASNTDQGDRFGVSVALSEDGSTLAVGALEEDSNAVGIDGNQADNSAANAGAVYVYARDEMKVWTQQAYVKASNPDADDEFGCVVALSGDGGILAVGAREEDSNAVGIDGNQADNSVSNAGAVYLYARDEKRVWTQEAYVKASNTGLTDHFGESVALSGDGSTLAVGAPGEGSISNGIGGNQASDSIPDAGAVYVYARDGKKVWAQQAYVKASNSDQGDHFGESVALSADGSTLAVGAIFEESNARGIDGDQANNSSPGIGLGAGAVYVYTSMHLAYVKTANPAGFMGSRFGASVALSGDGTTLAVGTYLEDSKSTGIGGNPADASAVAAGAVYLY